MEAQKNKRAIMVGLFIAIGVIIFLAGIFTLGGQQKAFVKTVSVTAVFDDVSGLQQGNNVWFSGVKVGTVKKIEFYNKSQVKVTLHIENKAREFIRADAKAKIGSDGLIGNKLIVISGGSPSAPAIEGDENLAIEGSIDTDDMMSTLQESNNNLLNITTDFKKLSNNLAAGQGSLGALLNERDLYNQLEAVVTRLNAAAQNSEKLTGSLAHYTSRLNAPGTLSADLISDTVIMPNLKAAASQLNIASQNTSALTNNLKNAISNLDSNNNAIGVLLHDEKAASDLKSILGNLNSGSKKLDEDLEALQHNFLLRGFFKKKARREAKALEDSAKANK
jgi:phospholipid/cholesterol/gamma-HCH transport system substrate-binding protein